MPQIMDTALRAALDQSQVIDLTTTGRVSGQPRRIEIFVHNLGGALVISGMPVVGRTRAWLRNVEADPNVSLHYKAIGEAGDIRGTARIVTEPGERRALLAGVARNWGRDDVPVMVEHSPLIVVTVSGYPG